jgi:hypothetical protein
MTCPPRSTNNKPTRCGWGPGFGCRSFANQLRWLLFAALFGASMVLMSLSLALPWGNMRWDTEESFHHYFQTYCAFLGSLAGAVLFSMACCTEHTAPDEQDTPTAQRCTWGTNLTCATFSNRIRWSVAVLGISPGIFVLCVALPSSGAAEQECEDCSLTARALVELSLMMCIPGVALILSMLCCIEKPFPAQVRHSKGG